MNKMEWKIDKKTKLPRLMHIAEGNKRILAYENPEWGHPHDYNADLRLIDLHPEIALISMVDGRGTTDWCPFYNKFICYSFCKQENSQILTTYLAYTYTGPVEVRPWDKDKEFLLENISMFHVDITPDRTPEKVIQKHLERISGKSLEIKEIRKMAEEAFFDMAWNIRCV